MSLLQKDDCGHNPPVHRRDAECAEFLFVAFLCDLCRVVFTRLGGDILVFAGESWIQNHFSVDSQRPH
jgi:hypothetical protein